MFHEEMATDLLIISCSDDFKLRKQQYTSNFPPQSN